MKISKKVLLALLLGGMAQTVKADESLVSGGLTLLEAPGARAASLGEAFSAAKDDASAFLYNPASLGTLTENNALFLYQQGVIGDSYGQFTMGNTKGWGVSTAFYKGGTIESSGREIVTQKDLVLSVGKSVRVQNFLLGATGKYFSSEIVETASAQALVLDLGSQMLVTSNLTMGVSLQNLGNKLQYFEDKEDLPRLARSGMSYQFRTGNVSSTFFFDAVYSFNQSKILPALGTEINKGPLSMRIGLKADDSKQNVTVGTGFMLGKYDVDYSFAMSAQQESAQHLVSVGLRFGDSRSVELIAKAEPIIEHDVEIVDIKKHILSEVIPKDSDEASLNIR